MQCYWWWLNGNTTREAITRDLVEMKQKGYGGAMLVDANGANQLGNHDIPAGPTFGSPEWTALYVHALDVAAKLGLTISLNITSGWNLGGPMVRPEEASKLLTWSRVTLTGPKTIAMILPEPAATNGFYRQIAVLAYPLRHGTALPGETVDDARKPIRALTMKSAAVETGFSMPDPIPLLQDFPATPGEQDTDLKDVRDISNAVQADGTLRWDVPAGEWEILRIGYTDSGAKVSTSSGAWQGLAIDYMDHTAFDSYWDRVVVPLLVAGKPFLGKSLKYLVTDSWELGGTNWTARFRQEFIRRRGYDPVPYLPVVAGRIVQDRDTSDRFLNDLRRTVGDLIVSEHYDVFAQHAARYGLGVHPESGGPHGAPIDALETFRSSSFPQTEFWGMSREHRTAPSERFFVKEAASAGHIYGKNIISDEGPTSIGPQWSESIGRDLKPTFDQALTEGLNLLIWHEFTSEPQEHGLPGYEYFAGTHLDRNVTWWPEAGAFIGYINRCDFLLQQGKPVADLLYYYGDHVPNFVRLKQDDPAHVLPGYDYDVTDEDALLNRMRMDARRIETPEGIAYNALALPPTGTISLPVLRKIEQYVRGGGVLIGTPPSRTTGLSTPEVTDELQKTVAAMWGNCDGRSVLSHDDGKGTVYCTNDSRAVLTARQIQPDFEYQVIGGKGDLDYIHRRQGDTDIYFVRNAGADPVAAQVDFRTQGKSPELWHPDSGAIESDLLYTATPDGRTRLPLWLDGYGSVFVVFRERAGVHVVTIERDASQIFPLPAAGATNALSATGQISTEQLPPAPFAATARGGVIHLLTSQSGEYVIHLSDGTTHNVSITSELQQERLPEDWTLAFPPGWGAPASVPVTRLGSWTDSADPGIRYFSGTATYRTTVDVPQSMFGTGKILSLDFGELAELASVRVNGTSLGVIWKYPFTVNVASVLRPGKNEIEISVTNLWVNRLIGDAQPSASPKFTRTNITKYHADSPLLPSGLLGPVALDMTYDVALP
jgi:alpha-L-rhamnosidase